MPELLRSAGLAVAALGSLVLVAMGIGAVVETDDPDWTLFIIGAALFVGTVLPLLAGGRRGRR